MSLPNYIPTAKRSTVSQQWHAAKAVKRMQREPDFAVCSSEKPSPWLVDRSAKIFKTFDEAISHLRTLA